MKKMFDYKIIKASKNPSKGKILFVHGYAVDYSYWMFIEDKFPEYDLYFVNLPGHGNLKVSSDKKEMKKKLRLNYMADYVVDFIKQQDLKDITLIGHSMGGAVVSLVEQKCPERIKKLILVSPMNFASLYTGITFLTKFFPKNKEQKMKMLECLYKDFKPKNDDPDWVKMNEEQLKNQIEQYKQMKFLGKKEMANIKTLMTVHKAQKNIKIPFMLCLGIDDGCISYKHTKRNFLKHHKDKIHLVTFTNSGHLCFEEETDKFVKEVKKFINQ